MAEQEQDRSEEATPHKKDEARKKGTVLRSQDVMALGSVAAFLGFAAVFGPAAIGRCLTAYTGLWSRAAELPFSLTGLTVWLGDIGRETMLIFLPLWLMLGVVAVVLSAGQSGWKVSFEPLKPDWQKVNPIEGFKRLFTVKILFEAVKSVLKFVFYAAALYALVKAGMAHWLGLPMAEPGGVAAVMGGSVLEAVQRMALVMLAIALLDFLFARRSLARKLRMSRREVKEEIKRRDGDPRIKSRLREIRLQFLQKIRSSSRVGEADVLIVNPRHLALAIQYRREAMPAPRLLAKGAGDTALKMRRLARRHGVPILENRPLARALFREAQIDDWIPDTHYAGVAKALAWAFRVRRK
ncbi:EscU/YscU/HrcU family type III secretion system export apparatus switch protein [Paludibacterium paludis]|uniref:Flagellar biosynthetic protein FlhB n=1 Tax=Paludibacterium paludis TaxID=1225769 RepID=A0A918UBZ6_9NEIS|nr:EscU/YscU/HrcU family type III secretion system export apparatus switch protein [Paludibacterium paludis]GGY28770.1 flagellar biosynthetic protein FlhB [Paludibacterium paludis]